MHGADAPPGDLLDGAAGLEGVEPRERDVIVVTGAQITDPAPDGHEPPRPGVVSSRYVSVMTTVVPPVASLLFGSRPTSLRIG